MLTKAARPMYFFGQPSRSWVEIRGTIDLQTTFGPRLDTKSIPIKLTVVNAWTSYNIILGHLALNRLREIMSMPHLCMKYPMDSRRGTVWPDQCITQRHYEASLKAGSKRVNSANKGVSHRSNIHFVELDPR
ncbi:hypothetical protein CR513_62113, partial [Mucuna pruriens]